MARGEGKVVSKAEPAADIVAATSRAPLAALMALIGGLRGPGYRLRLVASFVLTLFGKVLGRVSPLVLADGINRLSGGDAAGALPTFLGLAGFWAALRFFSTAGPANSRRHLSSPSAKKRSAAPAPTCSATSTISRSASTNPSAPAPSIAPSSAACAPSTSCCAFLAFNIAPTVIELLLAAGVLGFRYGWHGSR